MGRRKVAVEALIRRTRQRTSQRAESALSQSKKISEQANAELIAMMASLTNSITDVIKDFEQHESELGSEDGPGIQERMSRDTFPGRSPKCFVVQSTASTSGPPTYS